MIRESELRIGNMVDGGQNGPLYYASKTSDFVYSDFTRTKPMPITPDGIEAWRFVENTETYYTGWNFERGKFSIWLNTGESYSAEKLIVCVKALHRLQNLIFALA